MTQEHLIDGVEIHAMEALRVDLLDRKKVSSTRRVPPESTG